MSSAIAHVNLEDMIAAAISGVVRARQVCDADAAGTSSEQLPPVAVGVFIGGFPISHDVGVGDLSVQDHRIIMEAVIQHGRSVVDALRRDDLNPTEQPAAQILTALQRAGTSGRATTSIERFLRSAGPQQQLSPDAVPDEAQTKLRTIMSRLGAAESAEEAASRLDALRHEIAGGDVGLVVGMATGSAILRDGAPTIYDAGYLGKAGLGRDGIVHPTLMKKVLERDVEGAIIGGIIGLMTPAPGGAASGALSGAIGASVLQVISMF